MPSFVKNLYQVQSDIEKPLNPLASGRLHVRADCHLLVYRLQDAGSWEIIFQFDRHCMVGMSVKDRENELSYHVNDRNI